MRKTCGTILAAAIVVGCAALSSNATPCGEFKILSYNVHHCRGMDGELSVARVAAILNRERSRFAALQEIDCRTVRSGGMDEAKELERLTGMTPTFAKTIDFQGGDYGVMILSKDKPLSVEKFPLPGTEPRVLLMAEFLDCFVGCTHLSVADEQERVDSVAIIKKAVEGCNKPVFLAGDWNSLPDSPVLKELCGFLKVLSRTDCSTFHGDASAGPSGTAKDFCIDYIAVDSAHADSFKVIDRDTILDRISSDHAPVKVTLTPVRQHSSRSTSTVRPIPRSALAARLAEGPEIIGIVHWGLNTYTDREWGFGDEDPAMLNPAKFDADQIVGACKAGGIGGLVVVAKHHDGFCLWPTKTTEHNITKSPFGKDYVKEMEQACRRAGIKFGVYVSPWDRNNAAYGTEKYVADVFQKQIRELLSGDYGEIFEMWFDGANGGDGWYGGANEKRKIPSGYYRYGTETFAMVRKLQPKVCIFNEMDEADFRFGGNEQGLVDPDSRSTIGHYDGVWQHYKRVANVGAVDGTTFHPIESDFPLRKGWFYHEKERGTTRSAAYLTKLYLSSVGNASTMNIGIAPNKDGLLDADDVKALAGFKTLKDALFAHEVKQGEPFNIVVMREDISKGEQVDEWEFVADGKAILRGKSIGLKRIRVLETPCAAKSCKVNVLKDGGALQGVSFRLYRADPELVRLVLSSTTESGETDTAKWMTGQ